MTGILRDKTMNDKMMYIPNVLKVKYPYCGFKLLFKKIGHYQFEPTNQDMITIPKFLRKLFFKLWVLETFTVQ